MQDIRCKACPEVKRGIKTEGKFDSLVLSEIPFDLCVPISSFAVKHIFLTAKSAKNFRAGDYPLLGVELPFETGGAYLQ
ncbi:hypothetical protein SAMN00777080_0984 [Aquiflexum balticum DSM 16537]|uniref:Uncharacterized protein n=1 Tax=Aquiflexum balticum DSM 16537 TaxID=758820 RepID=A0A1W2H0K5_9BACT|nr:hypothetical protein SAMN00777080_0984 [Aquiflexum balticum DSM 16537]